MEPTNKELHSIIHSIGDHVITFSGLVLVLYDNQAKMVKMLAEHLPSLKPSERATLLSVASAAETSSEHLDAALANMRASFDRLQKP